MTKVIKTFHKLPEKALRISLHAAGWIIIFILPLYLLYLNSDEDINILVTTTLQLSIYAIVFYINYLLLIPRLLFKRKKVWYFVCSIALIILSTWSMEFALDSANPRPRNDRFFEEKFPEPPSGRDLSINPDQGMIPPDQNDPKNKRPPPPSQKWPTYNFLLSAIFITGFSMGMRYTEKVIHQEKLQEEKEKERLNAELAFLKNQINPHFFFNTLNNIYSLVEINVNDGQKAILQLSKLMRYVLYETEKGNKYLSQEIDFLKNYIELMKLRLSSKVTLSFTVPENYRDIQIPPLIFLPFIENAFKHGISSHNPSFITISLNTREDEIFFECTNSIGGKNKDLYKKEIGIGLENIKKRLSILFPKSHKLQIVESQTTFNVNLYIDNRVSEEV